MLHVDTVRIISKFLSDTDINNFLSASKKLYLFKKDIRFVQKHSLSAKIYYLPYYDSFTNLRVKINEESDDELNNIYYCVEKNFNSKIDRLPKYLSKISVTDPVNKIILFLMPNIKHITVNIFDLKTFDIIKNLPVTKLIVNNIHVDENISLPTTITHLKFINMSYFHAKKILKKCTNVTHLIFLDVNFNTGVEKGDIPQTVTHLVFGNEFWQSLSSDILPPKLEYLDLGDIYDKCIYGEYIYPSIKYIKLNCLSPIDDFIPPTLTHLELNDICDREERCNPTSIKYLILSKNFSNPLNKFIHEISPVLTNLIFKCNYHHSLLNVIPSTITHLTFDCATSSSLKYCIPLSVTHLILPSAYDKDLKNTISKSVRYLTLPKSYRDIVNSDMLQNINVQFHP